MTGTGNPCPTARIPARWELYFDHFVEKHSADGKADDGGGRSRNGSFYRPIQEAAREILQSQIALHPPGAKGIDRGFRPRLNPRGNPQRSVMENAKPECQAGDHRMMALLRWCALFLLIVVPIMMVAGHWMSRDAIWLYGPEKKTFSPLTNFISQYAYRSPVWPLFIASMYGFAVILGVFSIRFFWWTGSRRMVAWLLSLLLGYAGLKLVEVAVFPVKPPEIRIEQIQKQMDKGAWERFSDSVYETYRDATGRPVKKRKAEAVVEFFASDSKHNFAIKPVLWAIGASMLLCLMLSPRDWRPLAPWLGLAMLLLVLSAPALGMFKEWGGLRQRTGFLGVYIWMWCVSSIFLRPGK